MNEVQTKEFKTLMEIIKVLKKHNLRYFAIGGTCIGAIRHQGFIPWDDDIDIAMPRSDFELFKNKYYKELPAPYKKLDYSDVACYNHLYLKIHDSRTTHIEYGVKDYPDRYTGAFVDIMPVDGLPNDNIQVQKVLKTIMHACRLNNFFRPYIQYENPNKIINQIKSIIRHIIIKRIHVYNFYSDKIRDVLSSYDFDSSERILFTWRWTNQIPLKRKIYEKDIFFPTLEVPFESSMINVPYKYDDYLTQDFGNYMKLPPEENRNSGHNVYICDMKKPYSYYKEIFKEKNI